MLVCPGCCCCTIVAYLVDTLNPNQLVYHHHLYSASQYPQRNAWIIALHPCSSRCAFIYIYIPLSQDGTCQKLQQMIFQESTCSVNIVQNLHGRFFIQDLILMV